MNKSVDEYLRIGYTCELRRNPDGSYFAEYPDLPGCMTEAETPTEAVEALANAARDWIQDRLDRGLPVPEPLPDETFSGRFVARVPSSLHSRLVRRARHERTSLNQFVVSLLSAGLERRELNQELHKLVGNADRHVDIAGYVAALCQNVRELHEQASIYDKIMECWANRTRDTSPLASTTVVVFTVMDRAQVGLGDTISLFHSLEKGRPDPCMK